MSKRVVGIYQTAEEAVAAVDRLRSRGYSKNDISLAVNDEVRQTIPVDYEGNVEDATVASETHDRSFWEEVKDAFSFEEETHVEGRAETDPLYGYEEQLQRGYIAVIVDSDEEIDVDKSDYIGADPEGAVTGVGPYDAVQGDVDRDLDYERELDLELAEREDLTDDEKIQLREERLKVRKQDVQTGEVRIRKEVVEETETIEVPTTHEEVIIERTPVDGEVTHGDTGEIREEGEEIVIPVHEEQVTVDKENVVTEEVDVERREVTEDKQVTDTVRREELDVDVEGDVDVDR